MMISTQKKTALIGLYKCAFTVHIWHKGPFLHIVCHIKINTLELPMYHILFVCVEVLWPSQPNGVMSSAVSLPNHTFTGQA